MSTPLTSDQAITLLRQHPDAYRTPENLRELASQIDADASGKLTVLYSGPTTKEVWSSDVIKAMNASGEDVRVIDNSQAARFLQSRDFYHAVAETYGIPARPLINGTYRGPATDWLYDARQGPWADASARFVDATRGEVRIIASDARPDRVFGAVELPHALANPNITTIEDVPRDVLAARQASHGTQAAFEMVVARARDNVGQLNVAVNYAGTPLHGDNDLLMLDSRAYCVGTCIQGRKPGFATGTRPLADRMGPPSSYVLAGQQHWHAWEAEVAQAGRDARLAKLVRDTGALGGTVAVAYDAGSTALHASHLLRQHNKTGATSEIEHFASRNVAGFGLAAVGAEIGSAGGPAGSVTGALIGGGIGVFGGNKLMDAYDDHKIYVQSDDQGKSWHYDPSRPHQGWTRTITDAFAEHGLSRTHEEPAPAELGDRLNYQANTTAVELALAHPASPGDPFTQPATAEDPNLPGDPPWIRDAQTKQWSRSYVDGFAERGLSHYGVDIATPARAALLDIAAGAVAADNLAQEPRSIAERYRTMYEQRGWKQYGPMPDSVTGVLGKSANSPAAETAEARAHQPRADADQRTSAPASERSGAHRAGSTLLMDDPDHPGHALFKQAQAHVEILDAQHDRAPDVRSHNLAGFAAVAALANGITRIDALLPDIKDGSSMFIAQHTSPLKRIAEISTLQAISTPLERSSERYLQVALQREQDPAQQPQKQMHAPSAMTQMEAAPQMRV
ncbi:XVIPCD domain-containing protein [Dyella ginsengisoli]|uniref:XVIPCD domain-containing protein n=1 Tax=Dyella ginsengisoli TaxID=363848 RepID=UPI00034C5FB0|nr:XVIPCD domain-containing protein [Dyella ginsengisoli]